MSVRMMTAVFDRSQHKGSARLILLAIADYADDDGFAFPGVESLAKKANVSESAAHRAIRVLIKSGELEVTRNAGRAGANLYRVVPAVGQQLSLIEGGATLTGVPLVAPEPSSPSSQPAQRRDGQGANLAGVPKRHPPVSAEGMLARAEDVWVAARKKAHLPRFTDAAALKRLRVQVEKAIAAGGTWPDIERALRDHAPDRKASPWYADTWIGELAEERIRAERSRQADRDRVARDHEHEQRADAEWTALEAKHPGRTRAEIVRLEMPRPDFRRRAVG